METQKGTIGIFYPLWSLVLTYNQPTLPFLRSAGDTQQAESLKHTAGAHLWQVHPRGLAWPSQGPKAGPWHQGTHVRVSCHSWTPGRCLVTSCASRVQQTVTLFSTQLLEEKGHQQELKRFKFF